MKYLSSAKLLLGFFLASSVLGAVLLKLPFATHSGISWINAWFISVSAVCVTGLSPLDVGAVLTTGGKTILMVLIQVGGVGYFLFSALLMYLVFGGLSMHMRANVRGQITHDDRVKIGSLVKHIVLVTILVEALGAILIYLSYEPQWMLDSSRGSAIFNSVFLSVSAFCNAGFTYFSDSLEQATHNTAFLSIIMTLIVLGGVGFFVLTDLLNLAKRKKRALTLHSKLTLSMYVLLTFGGAVAIWYAQHYSIDLHDDRSLSLLEVLFQSVTARTAGFNTVPIHDLNSGSLLTLIALMFVGGGSGSIAGGIKVTTLATVLIFLVASLLGHGRVQIFKRVIPTSVVQRATAITILATLTLFCFAFLLCVVSSFEIHSTQFVLRDYLFETMSAFGTVGLSTGLTPFLGFLGKLLLSFLMLIGRVGPLTLMAVFINPDSEEPVRYAEEQIMIG